MKQYSEATRVQMPAMVHLTRLGYTYFGKIYEDMSGTVYDGDTKLLQKREMRKDIVIELSYKGFSRASDYS